MILTVKLARLNNHLHEKARAKGFPDVHVIVFGCEVCARSLQVEPEKSLFVNLSLEYRFGGDIHYSIKTAQFFCFAFYNLPVHDSTELLPHIISRLQTSVVHEVVVAPLEDREIQ